MPGTGRSVFNSWLYWKMGDGIFFRIDAFPLITFNIKFQVFQTGIMIIQVMDLFHREIFNDL